MFKLRTWRGNHLCSFVILFRGLWNSNWFVLPKKKLIQLLVEDIFVASFCEFCLDRTFNCSIDKLMGAKAISTPWYLLCMINSVWGLGWRLEIWATRCIFKFIIICVSFVTLIFSYFDSIMILDEMVVISHVGDELAIMLEIGNNFVINVEEGNVEGAYFLYDFMHWTITQG